MSIEIIDKLKQKNNGKFKLIDLEDVDYDGTGTSTKDKIEEIVDNQITLEKDDLSVEGISDTEHDTLTTKDKRIIGAINEINSQCKDIANTLIKLEPCVTEELYPKTYLDATPVSVIKNVENLQYKLFNIILDPINGRLNTNIKFFTSIDNVNYTQLNDIIHIKIPVVNEKQSIYIRIDDLYKYIKIEVENLDPGNSLGYYSSFNLTINMIGR